MTDTTNPNEFELTIELDSLTLGEIELIEERVGREMGEIAEALSEGFKGVPMGKTLRAFALVKMRRSNPSATWEDTANVKPPSRKPAVPLDPPAPPPVMPG